VGKRYLKVDTVSMATADEEKSYTFPVNTQGFLLQTRDGSAFKFSYKAGQIAANNYISANQGVANFQNDMYLSAPLTIYFSSSTAGLTLEVEFWL